MRLKKGVLMNKGILLIHPNNSTAFIKLKGKYVHLEDIQSAVGGRIELLKLGKFDWYVNDTAEGNYNSRFNVFGNIIIVKSNGEANITSLESEL